MDRREWDELPETAVRRTQATGADGEGASGEGAGEATHDGPPATSERAEYTGSQVTWLPTAAQRHRVELIVQRPREPQTPQAEAGTREAASVTELPATTREVGDAVGSGTASCQAARAEAGDGSLPTRSAGSRLAYARRNLCRMAARVVPAGFLFKRVLRVHPRGLVMPAAMTVIVAAGVTAVLLLSSSTSSKHRPDAAPEGPATALPAPVPPRGDPAPKAPVPGDVPPQSIPEVKPPAVTTLPDMPGGAAAQPGDGDGAGQPPAAPPSGQFSPPPLPPDDRALPPQRCPQEVPLSEIGCVLNDLTDDVAEVPLPVPLPGSPPSPPPAPPEP